MDSNSGAATFTITLDENTASVVWAPLSSANDHIVAVNSRTFTWNVASSSSVPNHETITFTTGTLVMNGDVTIFSGGTLGSNTAWTLTQKNSLRIDGTFNAPNASGTWTWDGTGTHINGSGTFNHDGGTLTITAGATGLGGYAAIGNGNPAWTWNNIVNSSNNTTGWEAGTTTVEGTLTANGTSSFVLDSTLRAVTLIMGTASASGTITGAGGFTFNIPAGNAATLKAASSAFPFVCNTTTLTTNVSGTGSITIQDGSFSQNITSGATAANTWIANSMTFIGTLTVSAGDTWKSISSVYRGAITATGSFWSVRHNQINGLCVYGKAGQLKFSTVNDAQYLPKDGGSIYVLSGCELLVDRGPFNETLAPASAPVYTYRLTDAAHHANANLYFADGLKVILPKGWSRFDTGVLGGSRINVAFRCIFGYGLEGETAGQDPALGTTTEGATGGSINVTTSNPDTGLNAMDFNQPAAATGTTNWTISSLTVCKRAAVKVSIFTDSTMAGASIIEGVTAIMYLQNTAGQQIHTMFTYVSAGVYKIRYSTDNATWNDFTNAQTYAASTRYEIVAVADFPNAVYSFWVNNKLLQANVGMWARNAADKLYFEAGATQDCHIYVDNIIICNLDVDTPSKAESGGFAGKTRIPVFAAPSGAIA